MSVADTSVGVGKCLGFSVAGGGKRDMNFFFMEDAAAPDT